MAAQWSSETFVAEFKDLQANAMAVDCLGKWALLLGKKVLAFVNLDNPDVGEHGENVVRIPRNSKWDPSCVQFNPHASHAHLFVTACNQRLDIYDMNDRSGSPMCSLKAHSRIISDVDWSTFDVNVVASCSIDCFTFLWDIRDSNRPIYSFQTVAGAHQVKWNKVTNNLFATTHEGDVRIWDPRKGNTPLQYIGAHLSKIYGLDWSPMSEHHLVTASQDCYVKLWDFTNPRRCDASINSGAPVWRARYTPFGAGLVTVVVPQVRRGENSLYLWSINGQSQMHPIHTFVGHKDVVLEFQWRKQPEGVRDQQLVTWSRDQSLRIWKIEPNLQRLCGHDIGDSTEIELASTSYNSSESTVKDFREFAESTKLEEEISITMATIPMEHQPQTLQQEFSLINKNIPNITIDEMDAINRTCRVTGISRGHRVSLELTFPPRYPNNAAPSFQFVPTTNLEPDLQKKIIKVLNDTCLKHVKRNNNCLEPCLRQLIGVIDSIMDDRRSPETDTQFTRQQQAPIVQSTAFLPVYSLGSFQDSAVPFPRTSGGRFCSNGMLVAFGVPAQMKKLSGGTEVTPKALSDLAAFTQTWKSSGPSSAYSMLFSRSPPTPSSDQMSISDFFTLREKDKKGRHSSRAPGRPRRHDREQVDKSTKKQQSVGKVKIYNMEGLLSVSHSLAKNYKLDINDIKGTCCHNASVSASIGRRDLVQVWTLVGIMSSKMLNASSNPDCGIPWAVYPMGRTLLKEILDHYAKQYDVQTLAMLCCLFGSPESGPRMERSSSKPSLEYVPPNTDTNITYYQPGSSTDSGWNLLPVTKNKRSLSWSDSYDDFKAFDIKSLRETPADQERMQHEDTCRMLDPELWEQYDSYKLAYARILYNWHLLNQRAQILNFISTPVPPHKGIEFSIYCHVCHRETRGPQCNSCKYLALQCSICHIGVRGSSNFCLACGHGGHTAHMMEWFSQEFVCPTGCGCHCLSENVFG